MSKSKKKPATDIAINIDFSEITSKLKAELLVDFIKYLMLFENIVPFHCQQFKYFANLFKTKIKETSDTWEFALVNKQREIVIGISESISQLIQEIQSDFQASQIAEAVVIFGTTIFTPQETYVITFPNINNTNHINSEETVRRSLRQLIDRHCFDSTSQDQSKSCKRSTNMFVFLRKPKNDEHQAFDNMAHIIETCKTRFNIHFSNEPHESDCNEFNIYEDVKRLNINQTSNNGENSNKLLASSQIDATEFEWYQLHNSIKRYECTKIKGKPVWEFT